MDEQNVTLSLPRSVLCKAERIARDQNRSLSDLMVELLTELVEREVRVRRRQTSVLGLSGPR